MRSLLKYFLITMFSLGLQTQSALFSGEYQTKINKENIEQKHGKIDRIYQFSSKRHTVCVYVLDDGYSLSKVFESETNTWNIGDDLFVVGPVQDDDDDFFHQSSDSDDDLSDESSDSDDEDCDEESEIYLEVENLTQQKNRILNFNGWTSSRPNFIEKTEYHKDSDGNDIVTITLDDGSSWRFEYYDERAIAKYWKAGEKIVLFVTPYQKKNNEGSLINLDTETRNFWAGDADLVLQ